MFNMRRQHQPLRGAATGRIYSTKVWRVSTTPLIAVVSAISPTSKRVLESGAGLGLHDKVKLYLALFNFRHSAIGSEFGAKTFTRPQLWPDSSLSPSPRPNGLRPRSRDRGFPSGTLASLKRRPCAGSQSYIASVTWMNMAGSW